jgi:hypothetical protein
MVMKMSFGVFWVMMPNLIGSYQCCYILNMQWKISSEMLVTDHKTTRCHNPEDHIPVYSELIFMP